MDTLIPYIIAIMAIIGIWMIGRYLYRKLYLRKFVLKDLKDINDAFSALVKQHNELINHSNRSDELVNKIHKLGHKQSQVIHDLTNALERLDNRLKKLEKDDTKS